MTREASADVRRLMRLDGNCETGNCQLSELGSRRLLMLQGIYNYDDKTVANDSNGSRQIYRRAADGERLSLHSDGDVAVITSPSRRVAKHSC